MRVLLVGSYAPSLVNFRGPLIEEMVASGHHVIAAAPEVDEATRAALIELGAEVRSIDLSNTSLNPVATARTFGALRRLIRDTRPDVLIAYTIKPVILGAVAARIEKVSRVVSLITGLGFAFTPGREGRRILSRIVASNLYRVALRCSDVVLFQNPDDRDLFLKSQIIGADCHTAIINGSGVDLGQFRVSPPPRLPSFLMIARLLGDKGIREFGIAASRLKVKHPEVGVRLAGYLDESPDSLSQAELDKLIGSGIEFLGKLQDVRPAIAACTVYVLPSYREGTPRSVLEAMAMGRAIITTDAPGCRETVIEGENGFLVPARDADVLYEAMIRFVVQPELAVPLGAASRRIAEERFDVHKVNAEIMAHAGLAR